MSPIVPSLLAFALPIQASELPSKAERVLEVTIEDALRLATAYSLTLQAGVAAEDAARYERDARWGQFDWNLRVEGSITDAEYEGNSELSGAPILDQRDQGLSLSLTRPTTFGPTFELLYESQESSTNNTFAYLPHSTTGTMTLGLSQPLLAGRGRDYATAMQFQAENEVTFQSEAVRAIRRRLIEQVIQSYWSLAAAEGSLKSADLGLQYANEFLRIAESRAAAGIGLELDVLQAQTELARRQETRTQVQIAKMNAEDTLRQFLYTTNNPLAWEEILVTADPLPSPPESPEEREWIELYTLARDRHPELRQRELGLLNAKRLLHVAESDEQSNLNLQVRLRTQGFEQSAFDAWEESLGFEYPAISAALRWELPLSGTQPAARTRKARAELRKAQFDLDSTERQLTSSMRVIIRALSLQALAYKSSLKTIDLTKRQHEIETSRYKEGRSTSVRVLAAQQAHLEALTSALDAQATYVIARGQLEVLLGKHDQ